MIKILIQKVHLVTALLKTEVSQFFANSLLNKQIIKTPHASKCAHCDQQITKINCDGFYFLRCCKNMNALCTACFISKKDVVICPYCKTKMWVPTLTDINTILRTKS